jgi:two-component system, OmpR family, sensor histidine kinase BaeS
MRQGLLFKLLGINVPVVILVILVLWLALNTLAADYFSLLMEQYHITPTDAHQMFLLAIHRYLLWAIAGALILAAGLSYLLTRRVLKPLHEMMETARLISGGEYSSRVVSKSRDEIGILASAFNNMAENLERIERLRRDMVSDVAHELRTPLTNIRGYLEALQDGVVLPTRETLDLLLGETLRLAHLVEDLLQLARADAARMTLSLSEVDVPELVARVLKRFELGLANKRIRVTSDLPGGSVKIAADSDKLGQVLENLLKNGLEYTPEEGRVSIRLHSGGEGVKFIIENSGPGIAPGDLPLVFERFFRAEKSRSRDFGGTGIGLAIVKELVEAHGGRVGVESDSGVTRFWFTLPLRSPSAETGDPESR